MDFAERDWLSVVTDSSSAVVLGRIEAVKNRSEVTPQESGGILTVKVLRGLGTEASLSGTTADVGFLQFSDEPRRFKSGGQGWNGVQIQPGTLLVLAAPASAWRARGTIAPSAVAEVPSEDAPLVQGLDRALAIEEVTEPDLMTRLLSEAVFSDLPVLSDYGHFQLGRVKRLPRETAVNLESRLATDRAVPVKQRMAGAATLETGLWKANDSRDPSNKQIVSALLSLLAESDGDAQRFAMAALYRLLVGQAGPPGTRVEEFQAELLNGVGQASDAAFSNLRSMSTNPDLAAEAAAVLRVVGRGR